MISILLLVLSGCATFKTSDQNFQQGIPLSPSEQQTLLSSLNSVSLTGEGKGKISIEGGSTVFAFESWQKNNYFEISFFHVASGEENLKLKGLPKDKLAFSGAFYERLISLEHDRNYPEGLVDEMLKSFHQILELQENSQLFSKYCLSRKGNTQTFMRCQMGEAIFQGVSDEQGLKWVKTLVAGWQEEVFFHVSATEVSVKVFSSTGEQKLGIKLKFTKP